MEVIIAAVTEPPDEFDAVVTKAVTKLFEAVIAVTMQPLLLDAACDKAPRGELGHVLGEGGDCCVVGREATNSNAQILLEGLKLVIVEEVNKSGKNRKVIDSSGAIKKRPEFSVTMFEKPDGVGGKYNSLFVRIGI